MNLIFNIGIPANEPVLDYLPGSEETSLLEEEIKKIKDGMMDIPLIIGGKEVRSGDTAEILMPHDHSKILAVYHKAGEKELSAAVKAAMDAKSAWEDMHFMDRAAIALKAADLISGKYRYLINAATMMGQSKNIYQSEIDAVAEMADFLRFNAYYMTRIYSDQPVHSPGTTLNLVDYRPLEGFVFAITPFNFTSIGGNLPTAPALMGNTVLWKPASTAVLSNYILMRVFQEAGFPPGVINFVPGRGSQVGSHILPHRDLAGIHFTGSTGVFNQIWKTIGDNISNYKTYPRIVGETGGKDFIFAHSSADPVEVAVAMVRGAFEFQGQKCSAASRAYIPKSMRKAVLKEMERILSTIKPEPADKLSSFFNAVIDAGAYKSIMSYIETARESDDADILFGGEGDDSRGYFIQPTVIEAKRSDFLTMREEIFGPVLTIYCYDDSKFEETLRICDGTSSYGLTGAVFASSREAVILARKVLRHAAGNFYINDKPTGAVVGQQPFGGSRGSGTNDKAGSMLNLLRWTSPRTIKENFLPPSDHRYPYMG